MKVCVITEYHFSGGISGGKKWSLDFKAILENTNLVAIK